MSTEINARESAVLDPADNAIFEAAREAIQGLRKQTFDWWIILGRAVQRAREIADRLGGRQTFMRLLEQQGLASVVGQKATWTRLLQIMENLPEVEKWRETLTPRQQIEWVAPTTIHKHCPVFLKPTTPDGKPKERKPTTLEVTEKHLIDAHNEIDQLKAHVEELESARHEAEPDKDLRLPEIKDAVVSMLSRLEEPNEKYLLLQGLVTLVLKDLNLDWTFVLAPDCSVNIPEQPKPKRKQRADKGKPRKAAIAAEQPEA